MKWYFGVQSLLHVAGGGQEQLGVVDGLVVDDVAQVGGGHKPR